MLTFNLKKEWFEKIKSGEKTHEYRIANKYWQTRITNEVNKVTNFDMKIQLKCGYPKANDIAKILTAEVICIKKLEQGYFTDLKTFEPVYDIEFELIKGVN